MSFEYILNLDCPVKQAIPTEPLVELIKSRSHAQTILAMSRQKGDNRPPSEIRFTRRTETPEGVRERSVSVQELLDGAARLDPLAGYCRECPANVAARPFGCYGAVTYPIRARTEEWLMGLIPPSRQSTAGTMLMEAARDLGNDGREIAALRAQGPFFESKRPVRRRLGSYFSRDGIITSDEVLQLLFCPGTLRPSECLMCALFLGLIPHEIRAADFRALLDDRAARLRVLNAAQTPEDVGDDQIRDMIVFLIAIVRAAAFEVALSTSY